MSVVFVLFFVFSLATHLVHQRNVLRKHGIQVNDSISNY